MKEAFPHAVFFIKGRLFFIFLGVFSAFFQSPAGAALIIDPTFGSSITKNADASEVEAGIDDAIARIEDDIENPVTLHITFDNAPTGLGGSTSEQITIPYSTYLKDLKTKQALSADDALAIASLPSGPGNPVNKGKNIEISSALYKTLGGSYKGMNGTVYLNLSLMNLSRTGLQNPDLFDLQEIATHEIDEILGIGGGGSVLPDTTLPIEPLDLFRYGAPGVRSFTVRKNAVAYFSINGGKTDLVNFNQSGGGSDYGDWGTNNGTVEVQDAYATPGGDVNIGKNELIALDVIGYNLTTVHESLSITAVPEPSSIAFLGLGSLAVIAATRRRII